MKGLKVDRTRMTEFKAFLEKVELPSFLREEKGKHEKATDQSADVGCFLYRPVTKSAQKLTLRSLSKLPWTYTSRTTLSESVLVRG